MTPPVCAFEAKLALMYAALRVGSARDRHDEAAVSLWRSRADEAREYLRLACGDYDDLRLFEAA